MHFEFRVFVAYVLCIVSGYSDLVSVVRFGAFTGMVSQEERSKHFWMILYKTNYPEHSNLLSQNNKNRLNLMISNRKKTKVLGIVLSDCAR